MKNTVVNWNAGFPENVLTDPVQIFAAEYFRVLVTGRYRSDGMLCVEIVNRMKRKTTGVQELDTSNALGVPLDGEWHWQTTMTEVTAWAPLPEATDPRWIQCSLKLPEEVETVFNFGRMKLLSVMTLSEVFRDELEVRLTNRMCVEATGIPYLDEMATDGWIWSENAGDVKAWMSFPEPAQINKKQEEVK